MNEVNVKSLLIYGVAQGVNIWIEPCGGKIDIIEALLGDQKFYMGINYLRIAKAVIVPYVNTLFIMGSGWAQVIPMRRKVKEEKVSPNF